VFACAVEDEMIIPSPAAFVTEPVEAAPAGPEESVLRAASDEDATGEGIPRGVAMEHRSSFF